MSRGNQRVRGVGTWSDDDWAAADDEFWGDSGDWGSDLGWDDMGGIGTLGDGSGVDVGGIGDLGGDFAWEDFGGIGDLGDVGDLGSGVGDIGGDLAWEDMGGIGSLGDGFGLGNIGGSGGIFDTDLTLGGYENNGSGLWDTFGGSLEFDPPGGDLITRDSGSGGGEDWGIFGTILGGLINVAGNMDWGSIFGGDNNNGSSGNRGSTGSQTGSQPRTGTGTGAGSQSAAGQGAGSITSVLNNPNTGLLLLGAAALLIATRRK